MSAELNVIYTDEYLKYDLGEGNPISRTKTTRFLEILGQQSKIKFHVVEPQAVDEIDLELVHTARYLRRLKTLAENYLSFDADTPVNQGMLEGGLYIVGGTVLCLEMALDDKLAINLIGGMHHAGSSQASGFCIYNDHAIAIRKLQSQGRIKKAAIVDLDVHAGQGTQEIFYEDPNVLTISIHQNPHTIYPGVGFESQKGRGEGLGKNMNICLPPGTREKEYLRALDQVLAEVGNFGQDVTVLLLGVDTWIGDQLGGLALQENTFQKIGQRFKEMNNLAVLFGGGYSTEIPNLWMRFLEGYLN